MDFDGLTLVRGKCQFWRERMVEDDRWDTGVKARDKRVLCTCFIDGFTWDTTVKTLPDHCPMRFRCRYFIGT